MSVKNNIKKETPLYENKADTFTPLLSNRAEVIISHDGFDVGLQVISTQGKIDEMVKLGYWKRL